MATAQDGDVKDDIAEENQRTAESTDDKFRRPQHPYKNFSSTSADSSGADTSNSSGSDSYLPYTDDLEMRSHRNEFYKTEEAELHDYYRSHPELSALLKDFTLVTLQYKPKDLYAFAREHFSTYNAYPASVKGKAEAKGTVNKP